MYEPRTRYTSTTFLAEHASEFGWDDGWPEDAGFWPERIVGWNPHTLSGSDERVHQAGDLSLTQFIKSLLRNRNPTWGKH